MSEEDHSDPTPTNQGAHTTSDQPRKVQIATSAVTHANQEEGEVDEETPADESTCVTSVTWSTFPTFPAFPKVSSECSIFGASTFTTLP